VAQNTVSPDYFAAMRIPLLQGRFFTPADGQVCIVDEPFAKQFFPKGDAIGRALTKRADPCAIAGIVGGVRDRNLMSPPRATIYFASLKNPEPYMTLVVRTAGDPLSLIAAIQKQVHDLDRNLPVYKIATMDELLANSLARRRFSMLLLAVLAALALALAAVGIYSVIAYSVSQRTRELGIRIALGAGRAELFRLVLGQGAALAAAGIVAGLGGALALTRLLASQLYGVSPTDALVFAVVPVLLMAVALAANYVPARRAAKADPMVALRYE
jgi:putative ABC transport system permease protein